MPEFNQTPEEQRDRIAALLAGMDVAEHAPIFNPDQPAHSPTASDAITMGNPSGNTQIALSELSDPDTVNGPALGPIMGPGLPSSGGRNTDLDRQADLDLADIGYGMPSFAVDVIAPGAFDMSGPPGDYGSMPSFDGMGFGVPGLSDYSPSPGPIGPGGALAEPGGFAAVAEPGGFAAGFAQGFDMASASADGVGDSAGAGVGDSGGMGGSEGSGSSSDSGGASGSSGVG